MQPCLRLQRATVVLTPTYRAGVLHPLPDLVGKVFNQGEHLITDLHGILDFRHGVEQRRTASGGQLGGRVQKEQAQASCPDSGLRQRNRCNTDPPAGSLQEGS